VSSVPNVRTGILDLDELLVGGIPEGRILLVIGGPGTGKTILATQFLVHGIEHGENGLFVSLDEPKHLLCREMAAFGWDLQEYERQGKFAFMDARVRTGTHLPGEMKIAKVVIGKKEFSFPSLVEGVQSNAKKIDAKRIVADTLTSFIFRHPDEVTRRIAMLDLLEALMTTGATCILTTELRAQGLDRPVHPEEYIAHGVIVLQTVQVGRALVRSIQVEKMREVPIDIQPRVYRIGQSGIEVFPKETIY